MASEDEKNDKVEMDRAFAILRKQLPTQASQERYEEALVGYLHKKRGFSVKEIARMSGWEKSRVRRRLGRTW